MTQNGQKAEMITHDNMAQGGGALSIYGDIQSFEDAQRMAKGLAASSLVPTEYRNNTANTLVALEMAKRTGSSVIAVMQNMHVIEGRPSWSSQFVIAALNSCGRFSPLRFRMEDLGVTDAVHTSSWKDKNTGERKTKETKVTVHNFRCTAWAHDRATGDVLEGPPVTMVMAVQEGWYTKPGSKWQTMPDLMLRYRAAKFFGNLYAPDVLMGMSAADEVEDFKDITPPRGAAPAPANENAPGDPLEGELLPAEEREHPAAKAAKQRRARAAGDAPQDVKPSAQESEQQQETPHDSGQQSSAAPGDGPMF